MICDTTANQPHFLSFTLLLRAQNLLANEMKAGHATKKVEKRVRPGEAPQKSAKSRKGLYADHIGKQQESDDENIEDSTVDVSQDRRVYDGQISDAVEDVETG